jgi:hypothetical protein
MQYFCVLYMLKIEWLKQLSAWNTAGADIAPSIVADPSDGSLYCAFQTSGTMSGGYNEGGSAIAVCKISSEGHVLWTHQNQFNTSVNEFAPRIALGPAGGSPPSSNQQIYIAFTTNGTVSGGELNMGGSKQDVVVMRLAGATGQLIWLKQLNAMNSSEEESEPSIIYYNENVYVAYTTLGVVSGGSPAGGADIVIAKLDGSTGELLALRQDNYNTMAADTSPALAEDSGNVWPDTGWWR